MIRRLLRKRWVVQCVLDRNGMVIDQERFRTRRFAEFHRSDMERTRKLIGYTSFRYILKEVK
ncbi:hypothetical protein GS882_03755 [Rhodococcus hoagii]|uniref:Uncharacterized protein n=1 Tax=Rhodococcus hoagii TaxID=43767 RepID=A0A9Q4ZIU4_RHOHA|nr:hypothetical protein [Prescottella equi]NKT77330.1 hypothetical protein [Prescottella equi]